MGKDCKYFSKQGVGLNDITKYLKNRFGDITMNLTNMESSTSNDIKQTIYGDLRFKDITGKQRRLFIMIPSFSETQQFHGVPVDSIATESMTLIGAVNDFYINLLTDIAKNFGGYLCKDDSKDEDDPMYWVYIASSEKQEIVDDALEGKIFNLYKKYYEKTKESYSPSIQNSITLNYIIGFIKENLDELKKL